MKDKRCWPSMVHSNDIVGGLTEDRRRTVANSCTSVGVLVVPPETPARVGSVLTVRATSDGVETFPDGILGQVASALSLLSGRLASVRASF